MLGALSSILLSCVFRCAYHDSQSCILAAAAFVVFLAGCVTFALCALPSAIMLAVYGELNDGDMSLVKC
jgi:hypothetical protein